MKNQVLLVALLSLSAKPVMAIESNTVHSQPQKTEQGASGKQRVGKTLVAAGLGAVAIAAGYMVRQNQQQCDFDASFPAMIRDVAPELAAFTPEHVRIFRNIDPGAGFFFSYHDHMLKKKVIFKMANYDRFWVGVLMGDMERLGINSEFFASNNHLSSLLPVEMSSRLHSDRTLLPQFEQLIRESAARPDPKVREYAEQWKKKNGAPLDWHYPNSF